MCILKQILDLLEGRPIYTLKGHESGITSVTFSPNGDYFASGGMDHQLFVWKCNLDKGEHSSSETLIPLDAKLKLQNVISESSECVEDATPNEEELAEVMLQF